MNDNYQVGISAGRFARQTLLKIGHPALKLSLLRKKNGLVAKTYFFLVGVTVAVWLVSLFFDGRSPLSGNTYESDAVVSIVVLTIASLFDLAAPRLFFSDIISPLKR